MQLTVKKSNPNLSGTVQVTGSKSESNRLLVLQALFSELKLKNLSNSDDTQAVRKALLSEGGTIDIHHAGTAMRFLTAYFSVRAGMKVVLTGSQRMQERPIGILVEALRKLGADIEYQNEEGYPPLVISGRKLSRKRTSLMANVSSQYITALMLIGAVLPEGLELELQGKVTSVPYIEMTRALLERVGVKVGFSGNRVTVAHTQKLAPVTVEVESDWSSASYFYGLISLARLGSSITLGSYQRNSLQGDSVLAEIYAQLGVETKFEGQRIRLTKTGQANPAKRLELDLVNAPDIAQTIAVTCLGLGIPCHLIGLHTLKIKETDRLEALKAEIRKLGGLITVTNNSLTLEPASKLVSHVSIKTYQDHRMAMAFAPLGLKVPIVIADAGVVSKSYPTFWEDLRALGFSVLES